MIITALTILPFTAQAQTVTGKMGRGTSFTFDTETGTMIVSGSGAIEYEDFDEAAFGTCCNFGIKKLIVKDGVTAINSLAFSCQPIESITLENVKLISVASFEYCDKLSEVNLGNVEEIGEDAFLNCSSLHYIYIPDTIAQIMDHALGYYFMEETDFFPGGYYEYSDFTYAGGCDNLELKEYNEKNPHVKWGKIHKFTGNYKIHKYATMSEDGEKRDQCFYGDGYFPVTVPKIKSVKLAANAYIYTTGRAIKPAVTVLDREGKKLVEGKDYNVKYTKNTNVGTAFVKVTFLQYYDGNKTLKFNIYPHSTPIKKIEGRAKGKIYVEWKKQTKQTDGYKFDVSTSKNFTKKTTVHYTIKDKKQAKALLGGLKKNKKYYVRMRTFKKVDNKTYYSAFSAVKTVKTRK